MARVMSQRLDRDHPLWEYWVAEGLAGGRWALISKIHHCMVDGVSGTDLYRVIFDASLEPSPAAAGGRPVRGEPSAIALAARAALDAVVLPAREVLVPVSLRAPGEESVYENQVSAVLADLPVHIADPAERLAAVRAELQTLKTAKEAMVGEALTSLGRYTPFPLASWWVRLGFGLPQRDIVTVTTNVPGPRQPLYGMGRQILEIIPYVPIATTLRTGISIFTYGGNVTFGITGDFAANPDLDVLAEGIEQGMAELLKAAA